MPIELSPFSQTIFERTYQFDAKENWEGCAARVAKFVANGDATLEKRFFVAIRDRKFMPGGRYLYSAGREIPQTTNCLAGETEVLTKNGIKPIRDLVGEPQLVLTWDGGPTKWVAAEFISFGEQSLFALHLRRGKATKTIYTTTNHDWLVRNNPKDSPWKVQTTDLVESHYLLEAVAPHARLWESVSPLGIMHGLWYGDGSRSPSDKCQNALVLVGDKRVFAERFAGFPQTDRADLDQTIVRGGPNSFKTLPPLNETKSYLVGFLAGYFATDGCVTTQGQALISSTKKENILYVRDLCGILGIPVGVVREADRVSNLTNRPSTLWSISLLSRGIDRDFFLLPKHHANRQDPIREDRGWRVEAVEQTDRVEEVFCTIIPETHNFTLADQIVTGNCFLMKAEDTREGWGGLVDIAIQALTTGGGVGTEFSAIREKGAPIKRYGGTASGPVSLMCMINEVARHVMAGGKRRSALWGGLVWSHQDIEQFIATKNWPTDTRAAKERDFNHPAPLDMMNVSVRLDEAFFKSYETDEATQDLYYRVCRSMCKTGEPGFSIDLGAKAADTLRNPCCSGDTEILTDQGYQRLDSLVGKAVHVWNGEQWSLVTPQQTGTNQTMVTVTLNNGISLRCTEAHQWVLKDGQRVSSTELQEGDALAKFDMPVVKYGEDVDWAYTHGFFCGDGHVAKGYPYAWLYDEKKVVLDHLQLDRGRCFNFAGDQRMGVALRRDLPGKFAVPQHVSVKSRVEWLAGLLDADGTIAANGLKSGPNSYQIQLASINWDFLQEVRKMLTTVGVQAKISQSHEGGIRPLPNGQGGMSPYYCQPLWRLLISSAGAVQLLQLGIKTHRLKLYPIDPQRCASRFAKVVAVEPAGVEEKVYCFVEPLAHRGTFEGVVTGQCTEVVSSENGDCCNLGSVNLARIKDLNELEEITRLATRFLYLGTFVGWLPHPLFQEVRERNRRIGLGVLGLHEWCVRNGQRYEPSGLLGKWLALWERVSDDEAFKAAEDKGSVVPIGVRAIAPTGTIGIVAETTTGIEPVFCRAFRRKWLGNNQVWQEQVVLDPTVQRLTQEGIDPTKIEDAYTLSRNVEARIAMQAFVQEFVDQAISSTINVPEWGEHGNNNAKEFSRVLMRYLPKLRGITLYPDKSRPGQPIEPMDYQEALAATGAVVAESDERCSGGVCGL